MKIDEKNAAGTPENSAVGTLPQKFSRKKFFGILAIFGVFFAGTSAGIFAFAKRVFRQFGAEISPDIQHNFAAFPNFINGVFQNSGRFFISEKTKKFSPKMLRHIFASPNAPKTKIPQIPLKQSDFSDVPAEFSVRWLGHSTLIYELAGTRFIVDPVFENAAPIPFAVPRYCAPPLSRENLPPLDFVLITHDHYDHLELSTIEALSTRKNLKFVAPLGVGEHLKKWGVPAEKIFELNWNEEIRFGRLKIKAAEARHFSGRFFDQ